MSAGGGDGDGDGDADGDSDGDADGDGDGDAGRDERIFGIEVSLRFDDAIVRRRRPAA